MRALLVVLFLLNLTVADSSRRLLAGVPKPIDIPIKCSNDTECNHGNCRNGICLCENGWTTLSEEQEPCTTQGKSQLVAILLCWCLGWLGAGAFFLHWWAYGGGIIASACSSCICGSYYSEKLEEGEDDEPAPLAAGCCACVSCCTWCGLTLFVSICACMTAYCVSANGASCKMI